MKIIDGVKLGIVKINRDLFLLLKKVRLIKYKGYDMLQKGLKK